jgi:predicted transcriptional regulator
MSEGRETARKRTEMLMALRQEHAEAVSRTQALLREQQRVRKALRQAMESGAQTVPELARIIGLPSEQVLWHLTAMRKYGLVEETGMDEDGAYCRYRLPQEA